MVKNCECPTSIDACTCYPHSGSPVGIHYYLLLVPIHRTCYCVPMVNKYSKLIIYTKRLINIMVIIGSNQRF